MISQAGETLVSSATEIGSSPSQVGQQPVPLFGCNTGANVVIGAPVVLLTSIKPWLVNPSTVSKKPATYSPPEAGLRTRARTPPLTTGSDQICAPVVSERALTVP